MFIQNNLNLQSNLFTELSESVQFENIIKGRVGTNIVDCSNNLIPIVRTTSIYNKPAQKFSLIHKNLITQIKNISQINNLEFNNGLVEIYTNEYKTMGFHSDQALDLEPNSYICICSFYSNELTQDIRKLQIKNKTTNEESEIILTHGSIVMFDTNTNQNYLHKIILDTNYDINTQWLGITLRLSKTLIHFINEVPYFYNSNKELRLANENEKKEFYSLRSKENKTIGFVYPELDYTISRSDLMNI